MEQIFYFNNILLIFIISVSIFLFLNSNNTNESIELIFFTL